MAYLQLIDNPYYFPAFQRASQVPSKGMGEKSLNQLLSKAIAVNQTVLEIAESIVSEKIEDIKPPVKKKLSQLVVSIQRLRLMAEKGASATSIIQELISLINYKSYLKKSKDWEYRWENVQELINFANQPETMFSDLDDVELGVEEILINSVSSGTPLRKFLHDSMLSTDVGTEEGETEMVTISTCHSAKGLEWPIVFIPGGREELRKKSERKAYRLHSAEKSIFPFYRSEDEGEERMSGVLIYTDQ
ncbi:hypothetical protein Clacol_002838 [Clathrus columnatus]|uniref:UvrD-like helicase C-terminal domain-containing protein n=1 Tax=Clathrus columnatus TaxID=1419009 RepID=A0AAV5A797_9AGAM|nr:hypothetical protein Clacol_002838 [Clathrus columnatus]